MASRRKTIIINKKFQYQYSLLLVAVTILAVNLFIIFRMLSPGDNPLVLGAAQSLGLAAAELVLVVGVWLASLRVSHKIAGPVYVFAREVRSVGEGDLTSKIHLRKRDMFQEQADEMNAGFAALCIKIEALKAITKEMEAIDSQDGKTRELLGKLQSELAGFKTEEDQS
ncbi:MAG: hypothetical protein V7754_09210 [Halioglobus sp.]